MRLATLHEFRRMFFTPASAPPKAELRAKIDADLIAGGRVLGGVYYVDLDEFDANNRVHASLQARREALKRSGALVGLL
jgi:hypothetical protein